MKKKVFLIGMLLLAGVAFLFGQPQVTDSSSNVYYHFGDSLKEFLLQNWKGLVAVALFFISEWLGETDAVPEGSIWRKLINWALELLKKQVTKSPKMKRISDLNKNIKKNAKANKSDIKFYKVFKVIVIGVILSGLTLGLTAQERKHPFRIYPFKSKDLQISNQLQTKASIIDSTFFFGASVSFDVFTKEMKSGDYAIGAIPGVGYGIKWNPRWNPVKTASFMSLDLYASAKLDNSDEARYFDIKLLPMIGILDWLHIGYGPMFRLGVNGTPGYNDAIFAVTISKTL